MGEGFNDQSQFHNNNQEYYNQGYNNNNQKMYEGENGKFNFILFNNLVDFTQYAHNREGNPNQNKAPINKFNHLNKQEDMLP